MGVALLSAQRSKDPRTQVGACLVNKYNIIVGTWYNGLPKWYNDNDFEWEKYPDDPLKNKHSYVVHAEANALLNTNTDPRGTTLYVGLFPCNECAKLLVQAWIQEIVYLSDLKAEQWQYQVSRDILTQAWVKLKQLTPEQSSLHIDFDELASVSK